MMPSANRAMRPRPPPESRFSRPRMLEPPKLCWMALTAAALMPGAGMCVPRRYRNSMAAVNRTLLRISPILNAPRIVEITGSALRRLGAHGRRGDHYLAGAAGGLDLGLRRLGEGVGMHGQRLGQLALGQDLDRDALAGREPLGLHRLERDRGAGVEASLEIQQVDRLGVRAEGLERHRLLHVRAAQLAHPHVDRVLAALEAGAPLGARARAPALLATARGLARARALAAADPLARAARPGRRLEVVQPDALVRLAHRRPSPSSPPGELATESAPAGSATSTRWRTLWTMPRICGVSSCSTVCPILRRPSERRVSSWRLSQPLRDLRWVTRSTLTPGPPHRRELPPRRGARPPPPLASSPRTRCHSPP